MSRATFSPALRAIIPVEQGEAIEAFVRVGRDKSMRRYIAALEDAARRFAFVDAGCFSDRTLLHYATLDKRGHWFVTAKALPCGPSPLWIGVTVKDGKVAEPYAKIAPAELLAAPGVILDPYFKPVPASAIRAGDRSALNTTTQPERN